MQRSGRTFSARRIVFPEWRKNIFPILRVFPHELWLESLINVIPFISGSFMMVLRLSEQITKCCVANTVRHCQIFLVQKTTKVYQTYFFISVRVFKRLKSRNDVFSFGQKSTMSMSQLSYVIKMCQDNKLESLIIYCTKIITQTLSI